LLSLLCLFSFCFANPIDLTTENFDTFVVSSVSSFIEFYAPWCGHCKKLAPEYEIVYDAFKRYSNVVVARVDCTVENSLCGKYGVTGYPTLKWFPVGGGEPQAYSGGRTADDIISFINSNAGTKAARPGNVNNVLDLDSDNFDSIVSKETHSLVKFFAPWCGHCKTLAPIFQTLANTFVNEPEVNIAEVDCDQHSDVCSKYGVGGYPTLKWFAKNSAAPEDYNGGRDLDSLVNFVNEKANTHRLSDGLLDSEAGLIPELGALVERYFSGDKATIFKKAKSVAESLESASLEVKTYLRAFEKLIEDAEYAKKEVDRLQRLLSGSSISRNKVDEFVKRVNILKQFF